MKGMIRNRESCRDSLRSSGLYRYRRIFGLICILTVLAGVFAACGHGLKLDGERKKEDYIICKEEQLPRELRRMVRERKDTACSFSFHDSNCSYLVVSYGKKDYAGYSIRVEECSRGGGILYLRTQLIGPSARDPVRRIPSTPWIVVRCARTGSLCLIEP